MSPPRTRPSIYDEGMLEKVCDGLAGGESLHSICSDHAMPEEAGIYRAMSKNEAIARDIARARQAQQDSEIEKTVRMADEATAEDWQVVKLRIWARQWRASKLAPKKYGDKLELGGSIGHRHEDALDALERAGTSDTSKIEG